MRGRRRVVGIAVTLAGLGVMLTAGLRASRYTPFLDPEPPCRYSSGGCPADLDAALRDLWWQVGAGGVLALLGVVLVVVGLSGRAGTRAQAARQPVLHAAAAGIIVLPLVVVGSYPALFLLFMGAHAFPVLAAGAWLGQAVLLAAVDRRLGRPGASPRSSALAGLAVSALATGATAGAFLVDRTPLGFWAELLLVDAGAVAVGTLLVRLATDPWPGGRQGVLLRGAALAGVLAVGATLAFVVVRDSPEERVVARPTRPSAPPPTPLPEPTPTPPPTPTLPPEPAPVVADDPCAADDLTFTVTGFDGAMGARATSIVARNVGAGECWVEGQPVVALVQGGRPLALTVEPGQTPSGAPASVQRVGLAPGGAAYALLTWRTYGGWADQETPQSLTVALDEVSPPSPVDVLPGSGPAPFDIADGGTWGIAPWAPPWS